MGTLNSRNVVGLPVVSQDGRDIGEVTGIEFDSETWQVLAFDLRLERSILEDVGLRKPMLGTQIVRLNVGRVSGVSERVVLSSTMAELRFVDASD